jgi:hypothetical protein
MPRVLASAKTYNLKPEGRCDMRRARVTMTVLVIASVGSSQGLARAQQPDMLQVHIGHIMESFKDTPKQQGLLPTALEDAKIAVQHAALAAKAPENLEQVKLHAGHVINAVDPSVEMKGPGSGYGVKRAAAGVVQHVELAAKAASASTTAKSQALYVARWGNNVVKWSDDVVELAQEIRAATSASQAASLVSELTTLTEQLIKGIPPVGRFDAQGGLQQAQERMEQMKKG